MSLSAVWVLVYREDDSTPNEPTAAHTSEAETEWRQQEYGKIAQLRGGLTLERFRELLGVPMFVTSSKDGQIPTEYLFHGRDYWVQALADTLGTVQLMTVTSCDDHFQPRVGGFTGSNPSLQPIVLNQTRLNQSGPSPGRLRYFTSLATSNSYYYDEYYMGNPGNYKTYFVGLNDALQIPGSQ